MSKKWLETGIDIRERAEYAGVPEISLVWLKLDLATNFWGQGTENTILVGHNM